MADTVRTAVLIGYADLAREVGLDPLRMLDVVGIPRAALTDPDMRISTSAGRDLLELASRNAEDFGLRLSEQRTPSAMGLVLLAIRDQPTVRDAIQACARHMALHSDANIMQITETTEHVVIRMALAYPTPGPSRQSAELSLGQLMKVLRVFLGPRWRPVSVSFTHGPPASLDTHRRVFGSELLFDQPLNSMVCLRTDFDQQNPTADREMARQVERYIGGLGRPAEADLNTRIRELVQSLLATGHCNIQVVAKQMAVDPRTLQRQLASAGLHFKAIVQEVRLSLAVQYLDESERPLAEIAHLLGFSALSAFSRWHHDHRGQSPSERRAAVRSSR